MKDYLQNFDFHKIDAEAPLEEPARQNYYIGIVRDMLKARFQALSASGRALELYGEDKLKLLKERGAYGFCHISTFGCQMNPEPVTA